MDALELLSGDAHAFVEKVWASHIHVHHAHPEDLVRLLRISDVDDLLTSTAMRTPALRIAKDGGVLPSSRFTRSATLAGAALTGLVDARKAIDLYEGGATLVLQGLHRYWPPLTALVRDLELSLGHPCQANAYLTPPDSQGFALHSDTHDVFVFQTHGRKLWEVHDEGDPRDIMLEPGTSVYLPSGTPHAARTQSDASLHVTVGVNQVTWRQVLDRVTDRVLAAADFDQAIPAGYLDDPGLLTEGLSDRLASLAAAVADVDAESAAQAELHRFLTRRSPELRARLSDGVGLREIDDDTQLRRRPGSACVVQREPDCLRLLLGDRELRVPTWLAAPIDFVREQRSFRPGDLEPWLDPQSRLVLARRLVREGLLQVEH